jgi:hypothetical protein
MIKTNERDARVDNLLSGFFRLVKYIKNAIMARTMTEMMMYTIYASREIMRVGKINELFNPGSHSRVSPAGAFGNVYLAISGLFYRITGISCRPTPIAINPLPVRRERIVCTSFTASRITHPASPPGIGAAERQFKMDPAERTTFMYKDLSGNTDSAYRYS